jgi:hypothetical protein
MEGIIMRKESKFIISSLLATGFLFSSTILANANIQSNSQKATIIVENKCSDTAKTEFYFTKAGEFLDQTPSPISSWPAKFEFMMGDGGHHNKLLYFYPDRKFTHIFCALQIIESQIKEMKIHDKEHTCKLTKNGPTEYLLTFNDKGKP